MNKRHKRVRLFLLTAAIVCVSLLITSCDPGDYGYTYTLTSVYTPKGTEVIGAHISELTEDDYNRLDREATSNFPNATRLRMPTNNYNCHSYAWHSQSADNTVWIGLIMNGQNYMNEHEKYWKDASYIKIASGNGDIIPYNVPNGSKVNYSDDDHSAIKTSSKKFTSKWGPGGLYEHNPSYCPYTSTNLDYYKYNKK